MTDVMIDIESLATYPGAAILSIGAVKFDEDGLGEEFHKSIDLKSCQEAGLEIDAETLEWWLEQDDDVTDVLTGGLPLAAVLVSFHDFCEDAENVWAKPPSFDCALLEEAYDACGMDLPWGYRDTRDLRTLKRLVDDPNVEREGDKHNALDDAKNQARVVLQWMEENE